MSVATNLSPNFTSDDEYESDGYNPSDLFVTIIFSCYILYGTAILFGIPCNAFVLFRMHRLAKKCSDMYSNGTGLCLFIMAIADIGSLCSIFVHYVLSINTETHSITDYIGAKTLNIVCKVTTFSMHISTFVSIWSWLLMSTLRYLSVYHPLLYIRLWRFPLKAMMIIIFLATVSNLWLLLSVVNDPQGGCTMTSLLNAPIINKTFLLFESFCSFIIPTLTIIYVDASVLCGLRFRLYSKEAYHPHLRRNISPRNHKHHHYLWRWLVIALIDIGLNAPENISRLAMILGIVEYSDSEAFTIYRILAQVPYYLQFGFNGAYLALFIYDKSTRPTRRRRIDNSTCEAHDRTKDQEALVREHIFIREEEHSDSGIEDEPNLPI